MRVSVNSVAGARPFGCATYTSVPSRSMIRRNSNATISLPATVRETASIAPPAAGVHRSSSVEFPIRPSQLLASHAMSASVALAADTGGRDAAGDDAVCDGALRAAVTNIGQIAERATTRAAKARLRVMAEDSTMAHTRIA